MQLVRKIRTWSWQYQRWRRSPLPLIVGQNIHLRFPRRRRFRDVRRVECGGRYLHRDRRHADDLDSRDDFVSGAVSAEFHADRRLIPGRAHGERHGCFERFVRASHYDRERGSHVHRQRRAKRRALHRGSNQNHAMLAEVLLKREPRSVSAISSPAVIAPNILVAAVVLRRARSFFRALSYDRRCGGAGFYHFIQSIEEKWRGPSRSPGRRRGHARHSVLWHGRWRRCLSRSAWGAGRSSEILFRFEIGGLRSEKLPVTGPVRSPARSPPGISRRNSFRIPRKERSRSKSGRTASRRQVRRTPLIRLTPLAFCST